MNTVFILFNCLKKRTIELRPAIRAAERLDPWPPGLWHFALVKCEIEPLLQQTTRNDTPTQPKSFTHNAH